MMRGLKFNTQKENRKDNMKMVQIKRLLILASWSYEYCDEVKVSMHVYLVIGMCWIHKIYITNI